MLLVPILHWMLDGVLWQQALTQLLANLRAHQVEPNLITHNFTLTVYEKGSFWQLA